MKLIVLVAALALTNGAKLDKTYLPPSYARSSGGSPTFLQTPVSGNTAAIFNPNFAQAASQADFSRGLSQGNFEPQYDNVNRNFGFDARPERAQAALERNAAILRSDNSNDGETYSYAFETENGIYAEESGVATNGVEAQGGYSYTGDDGRVYSVRYTADQNGFVPQGDHLPTPPPVPAEILRALEQNARDEAAGIYDDGSYNEGKYASNNQINNYQNNYNGYSEDDSVVTNSAARSSNRNFSPEALEVGPQSRTLGATRSSVENRYLPPFAQRGASRNSFAGRQNFNARTGYQY